MNFKKLKIPDLLLIEPQVFNDDRGFFFESFNQKDFETVVKRKINFVQDNHSKSSQSVLRGLHYQTAPQEQAKLVRVIQGEVWDVAVDVRHNSSTYGQWVGEILSAKNKKQFWIPEGFAHGFYVLSETAELVYKVNQFYSKEHEKTIHWKNNSFNIDWPIKNNRVLLSQKDDVK
ncbi:MAG: dTDP-4-dehydrorhamnose 3,5-epimerase [Lutibacter sp.]|nr:dTDP-4-dehydrorhamnose 3,5-epimerase [Lutibacter sp.]